MMPMTRRALAACLICFTLTPLAVRADSTDPAAAPVAALLDGLTRIMNQGSAPFPQRYEILAPIVDRVFNLEQVLQSSVGLQWNSLPPDQKQTLQRVFRAYTICNYVANFNEPGPRFVILPETRTVGQDRIVETEIVPESGDPTRMDYVMRQGSAGWQAIDVLEEGTISQAAVQRSDFRRLLSSNGAAALIESLRKKVDTLSGGTIKP
jgi:phospholipid transport system substrate-binding protein